MQSWKASAWHSIFNSVLTGGRPLGKIDTRSGAMPFGLKDRGIRSNAKDERAAENLPTRAELVEP